MIINNISLANLMCQTHGCQGTWLIAAKKTFKINDTINSDAGEARTRNSLVSSQALYHVADLMSHQYLSRKYKCMLFLMKYMFKE